MLNLGIKVVFPACELVNNLTSRTLLLILVTIPLDPLQTLFPGLRFLKIITGHPTFNSNFASGIPEQLIEFKYSTGYRRSSLPFLKIAVGVLMGSDKSVSHKIFVTFCIGQCDQCY
jgi:hypothetical protein